MSCTKSPYCRFHGGRRTATLYDSGFRRMKVLETGDKSHEASLLLCRLINDAAILYILQKFSIFIDKISEREFDETDSCLGTNEGFGTKIHIVLRKPSGELIQYNDLVSILLHELAHCWVMHHKQAFIDKEKELRELYLLKAFKSGVVKPWEEFVFAESRGSHLTLNSFEKTKPSSRWDQLFYIFPISVIYSFFILVSSWISR